LEDNRRSGDWGIMSEKGDQEVVAALGFVIEDLC